MCSSQKLQELYLLTTEHSILKTRRKYVMKDTVLTLQCNSLPSSTHKLKPQIIDRDLQVKNGLARYSRPRQMGTAKPQQ